MRAFSVTSGQRQKNSPATLWESLLATTYTWASTEDHSLRDNRDLSTTETLDTKEKTKPT